MTHEDLHADADEDDAADAGCSEYEHGPQLGGWQLCYARHPRYHAP
jgi:hypothetical protein